VTPAPRKGWAIASLTIGLLGLLTAGGCGLGALLGSTLGVAALVRARRDPAVDHGTDVAWAGIVTNVLGGLTIGPLVLLFAVLSRAGIVTSPTAEDELPQPVAGQGTAGLDFPPLAPPPPPPPPPSPASPEAPIRDALPRRTSPGSPKTTGPPGAVRLGKLAEPRKVRHVNPVYPEIARQARVQGVVILEATISPKGKVVELRVLRGVPLLDQAAMDAVRQWEYTPTVLNGEAVPVIMTITVNFRLS
jgi:protein TonB